MSLEPCIFRRVDILRSRRVGHSWVLGSLDDKHRLLEGIELRSYIDPNTSTDCETAAAVGRHQNVREMRRMKRRCTRERADRLDRGKCSVSCTFQIHSHQNRLEGRIWVIHEASPIPGSIVVGIDHFHRHSLLEWRRHSALMWLMMMMMIASFWCLKKRRRTNRDRRWRRRRRRRRQRVTSLCTLATET